MITAPAFIYPSIADGSPLDWETAEPFPDYQGLVLIFGTGEPTLFITSLEDGERHYRTAGAQKGTASLENISKALQSQI